MTDNPNLESPTPESVPQFESRVEALRHAMNQRMLYYRDTSHSYERGEISLIMDVLDKVHLTLDDLTNEELAELDELENSLFRQYLIDDYDNDDERGDK